MSSNPADARELLAFYLDAGVDALVGEVAVDRMADEPPATSAPVQRREVGAISAAQTAPPPLPRNGGERSHAQAPLPAPDVAAVEAREAAKSAATLDELRGLLEGFQGCALRATATQLVFADGNPQARVMFVGEAPGYEEDISGKPFVGRSGKLLDRLLAEELGIDRSGYYIANVIKCRPPGNRDPLPTEVATCRHFLDAQIDLVDPKVVITLGNFAARTLLGVTEGVTRLRGRSYPFAGRMLVPTYHPAAALRGGGVVVTQMRADLVRAKQLLVPQ